MGFDPEKPLIGADVEVYPDRVTVRIRGSKTDQYNLGCIRTQHESGDAGVCPVQAFRELFAAFPERRRGGSESHLPLFRLEQADGLKRSTLQAWLKRAAVANGFPPGRFGSHSLRIGGATDIYAEKGPASERLILERGRWDSVVGKIYARAIADAHAELSIEIGNADGLEEEAATPASPRRQ